MWGGMERVELPWQMIYGITPTNSARPIRREATPEIYGHLGAPSLVYLVYFCALPYGKS